MSNYTTGCPDLVFGHMMVIEPPYHGENTQLSSKDEEIALQIILATRNILGGDWYIEPYPVYAVIQNETAWQQHEVINLTEFWLFQKRVHGWRDADNNVHITEGADYARVAKKHDLIIPVFIRPAP